MSFKIYIHSICNLRLFYLAHHVHVGHFGSVVAGAASTAAVALGDVLSSYLAEAFLFIPDSQRPHCTNPLTQQHAIETIYRNVTEVATHFKGLKRLMSRTVERITMPSQPKVCTIFR